MILAEVFEGRGQSLKVCVFFGQGRWRVVFGVEKTIRSIYYDSN